MGKNLPEPLPEIVFSSSEPAISKAIGRAVKAGKLRKLAGRIYTSNLKNSPKSIIARNLYLILGTLFPNAVLSHRTAFEGGPTKDGTIFLTYSYTKKIQLPGLTVRLIKGPGPNKGDTLFMGKLYLASRPRAYIENMQVSRSREGVAKTLDKKEIEKQLENFLQIHGLKDLNNLRDQARELAPLLGLMKEFNELDRLIGAILGTQNIAILQTDRARARAMGEPYDQHRVELFAHIVMALKTQPLIKKKNTSTAANALQNLAFFEAYFSNYIEGTKFLVEEAAEIIFEHKIIPSRFEDTHDILGTYNVVSNSKEMSEVPNSPEHLTQLLQSRHAVMMEGRPAIAGHFKEQANRAGETIFVAPELVIGTLKKGFEFYTTLDPGIARAIFMMFLVAEVHPFIDGNGRIARIMMNAELVAQEEMRIIIPTVYREDYILALRRLSRSQDAIPYIRMLSKAQGFTANIDFSDFDQALQQLRNCNAFLEPHEGKLKL